MVKIMKDLGMDSHRLATIMEKTVMALPCGGQNTEKTGKNGGRIATYMCKFVQPKYTNILFWKGENTRSGKNMKRKMHGNGLFTQVSVINWRMIQMSGATPHINQSSASKKENCFQKKPTFHVCEPFLSWECSL